MREKYEKRSDLDDKRRANYWTPICMWKKYKKRSDLDEKRRPTSAGLGSAADCLSPLLASPHKLNLSTAANREHLHRKIIDATFHLIDTRSKYFFCQSIQTSHVIWICNQQFYRFDEKSFQTFSSSGGSISFGWLAEVYMQWGGIYEIDTDYVSIDP